MTTTKDLIAKAREYHIDGLTPAWIGEMADELERLTRPVRVKVEPLQLTARLYEQFENKALSGIDMHRASHPDEQGVFWDSYDAHAMQAALDYSAETVARLQAERDEAQLAATAEARRVDELLKERDALQDQVKTLQGKLTVVATENKEPTA